MITLPKALWTKFDDFLTASTVPVNEYAAFCKWLHYDLDCCFEQSQLRLNVE